MQTEEWKENKHVNKRGKTFEKKNSFSVSQAHFLCAHSTFSTFEGLAEAEILTAEILHVVLFESSADHLRCVVLAGQLGMIHMDMGQNVSRQKVRRQNER